jgi:HSP20 family protein
METDGAYRLRIDLPGVSREEVTINAENNQVTIQGERAVAEQQDETRLRSERAHGRFYRSLTFPTDINPDKAKAQFRDGVLLIDLPKVAKSKGKAISIS